MALQYTKIMRNFLAATIWIVTPRKALFAGFAGPCETICQVTSLFLHIAEPTSCCAPRCFNVGFRV